MYNNGKELLRDCEVYDIAISEAVIRDEMQNTGAERDEIIKNMKIILDVMKKSIADIEEKDTMGEIIGGEAKKLSIYSNDKMTLCGFTINKAMIRAFSCAEHNASMGKICAAPTAGSGGIIPATLVTVAEQLGLGEEELLKGLFTSAGVGKIIIQNATVSGAEGGCQAECGSAAAMAAAAVTEMAGGSPKMCMTAASIALKNIMGLICDPIAGLVESPCSKRNASGAVNAMISAEMALAGIESIVSFDETVEAMKNAGNLMHPNLKETAMGGIAISKSGKKISKRIHGEQKEEELS